MAAEEDLILNVIEKTTGNALRDGARDLDRTAESADNAGKKLHGLGEETGHTDREITRLKSHMQELAAEFDRTGNKTLLKDIGKDKSQLAQLERVAKMMNPIGQEGGKEFNKGFMSQLGELGSALRGGLIPFVAGAAVGAAPAVGAMIGAAVTGAVGLGGIAGGIAMASHDSGVQQAARSFGQDIAHEFFGGGSAFVQPAIDSLGILRDAFKDMNLGEALAPLAGSVTTIATGLAGFGKSLMPGLVEAFKGAVPVLEVFAKMLPDVGTALGDMLSDLANSQGSLTAMRTLMMSITVTLEAVGKTVQFLTTAWDGMVRAAAAVTGALEDVKGPLQGVMFMLNNGFEDLAGIAPQVASAFAPIPGRIQPVTAATQDLTASNSHLTMSVNDLKTALDELFDKQMDQDQALLNIKQHTLDLVQAVKGHHVSLKDDTAEGINNQRMILQLVQDYEKQRDAAIKAGKGTGEATRKFDEQVGALGRMLEKLGFNKDEINRLLGAYKKLHDAPNIKKEIRFNVAVTGQTGALSSFGNIGKIASFDVGGWVDAPPGAPVPAIVHGGEFVVSRDMMKKSAMPSTRAPQVMSPAGGGRIELVVRSAGDAASEFIGEMVQRFVYVRGGDPQSALRSG